MIVSATYAVELGCGVNLYVAVKRFELDLIQAALQETAGNHAQASKLLMTHRTTFIEKMRRHGLELNAPDRKKLKGTKKQEKKS